MKKRKVTICAIIFFVCLGTMSGLRLWEAQAAPKAATASNGKYVYYAIFNSIYRMDTNTGKNSVVAKHKLGIGVNAVYYKGYVYCYGGMQEGSGYIMRVKAKGGKVKKLARGDYPIVYNNKIYYLNKGREIFRMGLNGKNKKKLIGRLSDGIAPFEILNNRIFYEDKNCLYSASLNGKNVRQISFENIYGMLRSDGKDIYYCTEDSVHRVIGKTEKDKELWNVPCNDSDILDIHDGVIYFTDSDHNKLKKYVVSTGRTTGLKSFKKSYWINGMWLGKGKYAAIEVWTSSDRYLIGRIKKNGKSYKVVKKYRDQ